MEIERTRYKKCFCFLGFGKNGSWEGRGEKGRGQISVMSTGASELGRGKSASSALRPEKESDSSVSRTFLRQ